MAHCDVCCLRVSPNKDKTLPRHYLEDTEGWVRFGLQKVCPASGTTRYWRTDSSAGAATGR